MKNIIRVLALATATILPVSAFAQAADKAPAAKPADKAPAADKAAPADKAPAATATDKKKHKKGDKMAPPAADKAAPAPAK
jgi:hypothetical protein